MSTTKVNALTPAQEDALRRFHADWYAHGTSTEPSDRPAGANGIGPGLYGIHEKREMADEIRRVTD